MPEPFTIITTAAGLGIAGLGISIQIFEGLVSGFHLFEVAADADQSQTASKLRLQIEYARLFDWAELAGLVEDADGSKYEQKPEHTRTTVTLVLHQLDFVLRRLQSTCLKYGNDQFTTTGSRRTGAGGNATAMPDGSEPIKPQHPVPIAFARIAGDKGSKPPAKTGVKALFDIPSEQKQPRKHKRGFNHLMTLKEDAKSIWNKPRNIIWAAHSSDKFSAGVDEVKRLVDYLHYTLGKDEMQELLENSRMTQMCLLTLTSDIAGMKDLLNVVKNVGPVTSIDQNTLSGNTLVEDEAAAPQTTESAIQSNESGFRSFLQQAIDFKIRISTLSPEHTKLERIPFEDVEQKQVLDDGLRVTASYAGRSDIWIEWKRYHAAMTTEDGFPALRPDTLTKSRAAELSTILKLSARPAEFCVPSCLGVIQDNRNERFGFLFESPSHGQGETAQEQAAARPVSLHSLLSGDSMALRGRVALALKLAQCIVLFHTVDWLHKGFRSASVLFFGAQAITAGDAFISGFEYARPGRPNSATSTGPPEDAEWSGYIHPEYLGEKRSEGFKRTYDIYSLGIVLVEIALWKRVKDTLGSKTSTDDKASDGISTSSPDQMPPAEEPSTLSHSDQIASWLLAVGSTMGTKYRNATEACLRGMEAFGLDPQANQSDPVISALIQQEVIAKVVDELKGIVI